MNDTSLLEARTLLAVIDRGAFLQQRLAA